MDGNAMSRPDPPAANHGQSANAAAAPPRPVALDLGPIYDFTKIVSLKVSDMTFYVHKDIIIKDSAYFDRALNGPFKEGQSQSIEFDDMSPGSMTEYLRIKQASYYVPDYKLRGTHQLAGRECLYPLIKLMELWQLADRLLDTKFKALVEEALGKHWELYSVTAWSHYYRSGQDARGLGSHVKRLWLAYTACKVFHFPFETLCVTACANMPPQVFADVFPTIGGLSPDFRAEVTSSFALRHADPELTETRKRNAATEVEDSELPSAKNQKV